MTLPIVIRSEAGRDVEETRDFYEEQRSGLGQVFLDRLKEMLERIQTFPGLYGRIWQDVHAGRLTQFPHVVYYRILSDRIEVFAVIHGRRHPATWQSRV